MGLEDVITIAVYKDDTQTAVIKVRRGYVTKLAKENGLDTFLEDSLGYYTCVDGPILVIWGLQDGKSRIIGLTIDVETLRPESALRQAWESHKSEALHRREVHAAILRATDQVLN